jgi:hypothetical protein
MLAPCPKVASIACSEVAEQCHMLWCLLIDLHLEALAAKRNGRRQSSESGPYDSNPTRTCHTIPPDAAMLERRAGPGHRQPVMAARWVVGGTGRSHSPSFDHPFHASGFERS